MLQALGRSTLSDLQDAGTVYTRRLCSVGVLKIHFERATTRMRLVVPDLCDPLAAYAHELEQIDSLPKEKQFLKASDLLDRFDRFVRDYDAPARPNRQPDPRSEPIAANEEAPLALELAPENPPAPPDPSDAPPLSVLALPSPGAPPSEAVVVDSVPDADAPEPRASISTGRTL